MVGLENGKIYRFVSPRYRGALELDESSKKVVVNDFTGSQWQQWTAIKAAGGLWKFSNVASGLYLGTDAHKAVSNGLEVIGTSNEDFTWQLRLATSPDYPTSLKITVPYTNIGLDAASPSSFPSVKTQFWEQRDAELNQIWVVDRVVEPAIPCVTGGVYKIVNVISGTVAHLESNGNVRGYEYNEGRNQLWEAIHDSSNPYFWSFKNILNGQYLSIKDDIAKKDSHLVSTRKAFKWRLVPDALTLENFQIYVPYVNLSVDLHNSQKDPGTLIHLWSPNRERHWRFEKVEVPNKALPIWASEYPGATPCDCAQKANLSGQETRSPEQE